MSHTRRRLWPIAVLVLATISCTAVTRMFQPDQGIAPGAAPEATETPLPAEAAATEVRRLEAVPTPTPFHVLSEDDVRSLLDLTKPDHIDYFDTPAAWFDYDTPGRAAYRVEDGRLLGIDYEPEELYSWWSNTDRQSGNVYAEVSATNGDCVDKDAVGMVIRVDTGKGAGGYALEVSCDGEWRFRNHRFGRAPDDLTEWAPSDAIQAGAGSTNRLGIWGYQGRFVVFINGVQVAEILDKNYKDTYGTFALYVRADRTFDLTAEFDDFAFWHIPFIP
jgi:hypothetical protein